MKQTLIILYNDLNTKLKVLLNFITVIKFVYNNYIFKNIKNMITNYGTLLLFNPILFRF